MRNPLLATASCLLILLSSISTAQQPQSKTVDVAQLRPRLSQALGEHLTIVKDELTRRSNWHGGQLFWLVYVQPKHVGHYALRYRYNYNGSHYSHVERELPFRAGKQGCLRDLQDNGLYARFCLGDTVILPIAIENYTEHEFSLKFTSEQMGEEIDTVLGEPKRSKDLPNNPVEEHLVYIGNNTHKSLHRAGGYTLERYATFEARKPGRFNLWLTSSEVHSAASPPEKGGTPIIVVDRMTPITGIAGRESLDGFTMGFNGQEYNSSSGGGTSYLTNVVILQTGDRFTFSFFTSSRTAKMEWAERNAQKFDEKQDVDPVIYKLPFSFDKDWGYNEWIKDYPPLSGK